LKKLVENYRKNSGKPEESAFKEHLGHIKIDGVDGDDY